MWWLIIVSALLACFALAGLSVAPYVPIRSEDMEAAFDLFAASPGQVLLDLGAGDGRMLKYAAARGLKAVGYEINPIMCVVAWLNCLSYRRQVKVVWRSMWRANLGSADLVYVFLIPKRMARLDQILQAADRDLKLVSYAFRVPGRLPVRSTKNSYLYHYPNLEKQPKHS